MKRFLIVVLFVACIVSTVSAGLISFGVGVNALNTIPTDGESVEIGTFEDWNFGTELRLGVLFLEATVNGRFTGSDQFKGVVTAGTSMSLFDLLHVGVGAGPALGLQQDGGEIGWFYVDSNGSERVAGNDLAQAFNNGLLHYRAHGDLKLGRLSFGVTYEVPSSGYTLDNNKVLDLGPEWDKALVGASVLFWLF